MDNLFNWWCLLLKQSNYLVDLSYQTYTCYLLLMFVPFGLLHNLAKMVDAPGLKVNLSIRIIRIRLLNRFLKLYLFFPFFEVLCYSIFVIRLPPLSRSIWQNRVLFRVRRGSAVSLWRQHQRLQWLPNKSLCSVTADKYICSHGRRQLSNCFRALLTRHVLPRLR